MARNDKQNISVNTINTNNIDLQTIIDLNHLTAKCFEKAVPLDETIERVGEADLLVILKSDIKIIGYGTNNIIPFETNEINYFGSGFIDLNFRGQGLYHLLNQKRITCIDSKYIMTRTQNPKVMHGFNHLCQSFNYSMNPSIEGIIDSFALKVAKSQYQDCNDQMICKNAYGRELMANTPKPTDFTKHMVKDLDVDNGDAIVLVGIKQ